MPRRDRRVLPLVVAVLALLAATAFALGTVTNAVTLLISVALGVTVFGEKMHRGGGHLALVAVGLALVLLGVILLARAPAPQQGRRPHDAEQPPSPARTPAPGAS
jgi:TRAP-type C4-dicarboxylate transport system permease small subunit